MSKFILPKAIIPAPARIIPQLSELTNNIDDQTYEELCDSLAKWGASFSTDKPLPRSLGFEIIAKIRDKKPKNLGNLSWLLPAILTLEDKPYTIVEHFEMEPLFSTSLVPRTLLKCGRQVCADLNSPIKMSDGSSKLLKDIKIGDKVTSLDDNLNIVVGTVSKTFQTGKQEAFKVKTRLGSELTITAEHRIKTIDGYKKLKCLSTGSNIIGIFDDSYVISDAITAIESVGIIDTGDLEIEKYHNFVIDNIVTHNSKSTSYAASIVMHSIAIPNFKTMYVAPLKEHSQKFSLNRLQPFLDTMTLSNSLTTARGNRVMQKDLLNGSKIFLFYAYTDAERIRGNSTDKLVIDECQLIDETLLQAAVYPCLTASKWDLRYYSGTPNTFDNLIEKLWTQSSQAEWRMKCPHCGKYNYATLEDGVMDMIQPAGLMCLDCKKILDPANSELCTWEHRVGHLSNHFAGYHIPQVILPLHYNNPMKWRELLKNKKEYKHATFVNEILGESCDVGAKLLTTANIKTVSILHKNDINIAAKHALEYPLRVLGVDWGGGGEEDVSFTTPVICGINPGTSNIDIIYMERLQNDMSYDEEIARILQLFSRFKCHKIAHDGAGAGQRPVLLSHAGFKSTNLIPFWYTGNMQNFIVYHPPKKHFAQPYYSLHKSNAIRIICDVIRTQGMFFPEFESSWPYTQDFLNLREEKAADYFKIGKASDNRTDDFVHSIVFAATALWYMRGKFPDLAKGYNLKVDRRGV